MVVEGSALKEIYTCPLYGSENSGKNVRVEDTEEDYDMPSSGQDAAILVMNSQHLWLPASVSIRLTMSTVGHGSGRGSWSLCPAELWATDRFEMRSSPGLQWYMHCLAHQAP